MPSLLENPEKTITILIQNFVTKSSKNRASKLDGAPFFEAPLVGFADAGDQLFTEFKNTIGDFHLTPMEILTQSFPEHQGSWDGASVISWVLPISKHVRESNRRETRYPSKHWAHTRTYGEDINDQLHDYIVSLLKEQELLGIAPMLSSLFEVLQSEKVGLTSNWSVKHAAYVAGLGTFGLSRNLISKRGAAIRCGSVVTNLKLRPSPRSYENFQEYCLFYTAQKCGKCIERCPSGAITEKGQDKERCLIRSGEVMQKSDAYDAAMPGCGLCQTAVPCEAGIPNKLK